MKVRYRFVTGEVSDVEVSAELADVLLDLDRQEHNNNQTETRRHVSLDMMTCELGIQLADTSSIPQREHQTLNDAISMLRPEQLDLLRAVFFEGVSISEYAKKVGVSQPAITQRLQATQKELCKLLGQPYK